MNIVKVKSTRFKNLKLLVKFLRYGKSDVQECTQVTPYGFVSRAVEDTIAVYSKTAENGKPVIIGYVNKNDLVEVGEARMFSTDENGVEKFYILNKKDGHCEFGGVDDNMVRFKGLDKAFNELKSDFNNLVTKYNAHTHITTATIGASTAPGVLAPTTSSSTTSQADITQAKIEEITTL